MEVPIVAPPEAGVEDLNWDVVLHDRHDTEYGPKVYISSPFAAKDHIKDLDWERTHRSWDEEADKWSVDLDAVGTTVLELSDAGFSVAVTEDVARAIED